MPRSRPGRLPPPSSFSDKLAPAALVVTAIALVAAAADGGTSVDVLWLAIVGTGFAVLLGMAGPRRVAPPPQPVHIISRQRIIAHLAARAGRRTLR